MRSMETDFNCLSGERLMGYISTNFSSESSSVQGELSAEKLLLSTLNDSKKSYYHTEKTRNFGRIESKRREFHLSLNNDCVQKSLASMSQVSKEEIKDRDLVKKTNNSFPVSYGKYREIALNQQLFLSFIDNWRKEVGIILNENYKEGRYTLEEGKELLQEGLIFQRQVRLPELESLSQAVKKASDFENKVKEAFSIGSKELNLDLGEIKPANKIQIKELRDLLKEGEECLFYSKCLDLLKFQLEKLKTWRKTVQSAIIEKNLDKCKDSMKDKDEIFIEVPGTDGLTEQIAASNWIEKVERSLSRPMRLNFAESLLNEPAAKFLNEKDVYAKRQLISRVNRALDWLNVVQSPPFVFNLVSACKGFTANDIPDSMQAIIVDAKKLMETTNDWKLPKPSDFEKIWLESLTLKISVPISKYMEPVYLRWKKWHRKFKRLMDGLCIYMEAQLILEEAEYTLCDFLDMSEYLPVLKSKIKESGDWLNESKDFLRSVSEYNTKQDIDDVSSSVWNTITGIKKGNEFTKHELQEVINFIQSQIGERLSYDKLKQLIDKGNELTIYDTSILQELSSCLDGCERWLKKGRELIKCSKSSNSNVSSIISLLLERSSILISSETEESLFAELNFLLWKLEIKEIQIPIDDDKLLSLIERLNCFKSHINFNSFKVEFKDIPDSSKLKIPESEKESSLEAEGSQRIENVIEDETHSDIDINLLTTEQINSSHWKKLKELGPILFVEKLEQIYKYWSSVASSYEKTKSRIECWNNLLDKLKILPVKMNKLEEKVKIIIDEYERICLSLSSGNKELIESKRMGHPLSLLFSYEELTKLAADIENIPVKIDNWDKWLKHIEDLNNSDILTLERFPYLSGCIYDNTDEDCSTSQIEMDYVNKHIELLNNNLISTSVWNITDFKRIFRDLKYTGKLINDLESCKKWMEEVESSENCSSKDLDYWKELLQKGKNLNIVDNNFLSNFESRLNISIEWDEIYKSVILEEINKPIRAKKTKLSSKKIPYYFAKLLVDIDYGIGERLNSFKELKESVNSYVILREKGIKYLEICHNERIQSRFSEILDKSPIEMNAFNESIVTTEVKRLNEFTSALKEFQNECLKHPILIEFTNYIQEEILLRDLNQKLINTLIIEEYHNLLSLTNNTTLDLLEPRVNDIDEGIELINYIEGNNLYSEHGSNSKIKSTPFSTKIIDEAEHKPNYSIDELKKIFSEELNFPKDIVFGDSLISEKYIDNRLFQQFKNSVKKAKQWLNIFNSLGFNVVNNSKTETFYNRTIPSNLLPKNFKSSIELLMDEYTENLGYHDTQNDNVENGPLAFRLDWNKILEPYLKMDYCNTDIIKRSNTLLNRLLEVFNPDLFNPRDLNEANNSSEDYSVYNVSLLSNLLHYMREKKSTNSRVYCKENYEEINNMVKSIINEKYFVYLPVNGGNDLEQLGNILNASVSDIENEKDKNLSNSQFESLNISNQGPQKRVKRSKNILEERVNESNVDGILDIVRKIPLPTIEMSLLLLSFAIKNIKFNLLEVKNLALTIELTFLWIALINHKFPSIFSSSDGFDFNSGDSTLNYRAKTSDIELEIWENLINFDFYDSRDNCNIENLCVQNYVDLNKDSGNKMSLRELIFLIEICDQMPIQTPFKTKLVVNLINILKWTLSAREAILLLPRNTILRPWLHIEGVNEEIETNRKNCRIINKILSKENEFTIEDDDINKIISNICSHENENHLNVDKVLEVELIKKIPRPRGRPKRESINSSKGEITPDEIYNSICSEYKVFDRISDNFPRSFYSWLKESEELLTDDFFPQMQTESEKNNIIQDFDYNNNGTNLKYGWINGYFYWYDKDKANKTEIDGSSDTLIQRIGMIDPNSYPKKSKYNNKLIIDFIISIEVFFSIENTPADLCSICSTFSTNFSENDTADFNHQLYWISCSECSRWYHKECAHSNAQNRKNFNFSKSIYNDTPWICQLCSLRGTTSSVQSEAIISQLRMGNNISLCHNNNKYIISQIKGKPEFCNQVQYEKYNNLQREIYSQENLKKLLFNSLFGPISYVQLYERNAIYNRFYLLNVWIHDFQNKFKWDIFDNSTYDPSIFVVENTIGDIDIREKVPLTKVKNESSELVETILLENQNIHKEKVANITENMSTSRKGRIIKNKISVKEMLNPKISLIKTKKGMKRRLLIPIHSTTRQIKRIHSSTSPTNTVQVNFRVVFREFNCENITVDPNSIGRLRKLEFRSEELDIHGMINLYLLGILTGVDQIVEMEWLYCILKYLTFFNKRFHDFNKNLESLKIINLPRDLSFINSLGLEKRFKWDEFKYILRFYSPNFPIKLNSSKNFYSGILSVRSNYFNLNSILRQFSLSSYSLNVYGERDTSKNGNEFENEVININSKNLKSEIEILLNNMVKSGVTFSEEEIICQILRTYYLESMLIFIRNQISNFYNNQLNPKPIFSHISNTNEHIKIWKETDAYLIEKYKIKFLPPEINNMVSEDLNESGRITRFQFFTSNCDLIRDIVEQCNEWSENYMKLKDNCDEFGIFVDLLKQGLSLPCVYPPVYSFGNVLASIESYEDFVDQVFCKFEKNSTSTELKESNIQKAKSGNVICSDKPSTPKFENIQVLKNIKKSLSELPIQKRDLNLKIEKMENNVSKFIESIKEKTPILKQTTSTESLISKLQLIKEEALLNVPIIVTNLPELRELLNSLPDFGSPHHNLLVRTQFLMSLQSPIAKLRKPLNPFPNVPVSPNYSGTHINANSNETISTEVRSTPFESIINSGNCNRTKTRLLENLITNSSQPLTSDKALIWQNVINNGVHQVNHCYYK
ncbi:hypothetical protein RS030_81285 [Cryptosporidium xiaoi]|uniref:PHD-type domain-containing protein n=1 Tax=Cryptosporidium xiaoi TaxID=659607 RepID=A0AAV9XVQ9_9CRYT